MADFYERLLVELIRTSNDGNGTRLVDLARPSQRHADGAHLALEPQ